MRPSNVQWRKSSRSAHEGGECVEVADLTGVVGVRDSKDAEGPRLVLPAESWRNFTRRLKDLT
ncbi:DUF397 domain-containing protein [Spirillospora sp. NPDC052269]